jgi:alanine racemase
VILLSDLLAATGARVLNPRQETSFGDFAFDSRNIEPGQLFLALVTETGDGHDYILDACRAGATGVLCQRAPADLPSSVIGLIVENTQQALLDYARYILARRHIEVIGVTGSLGKTTTKEAIAAVLAVGRSVFKNYGSYNGRFGLPVALGQLEEGQQLAILEMACDSLDEIRDLAEITRPVTGVVTSVSHSHLEFLGTLEDIAREKGRLVEALPAHGLAILNHDDTRVRAMAERTRARVLTFGLHHEADLWADDVAVTPTGTSFSAHWGADKVPLRIPLLGAQCVYAALAAAAVGLAYGLDWAQIAKGLDAIQPLPGRTRLLAGIRGSQILDDSYNANPASTSAALDVLGTLPAKRRLAVLGDMVQLGDYTEEGHRLVGRRCAQIVDVLVTKGELARLIAEEALHNGLAAENVHITYSTEDAVRALRAIIREGDLVLLKGSAESRLEFVTRELLREPQSAPSVLPRQNRGWMQVRLQRPGRPTWVEIDLKAIGQNVRQIVNLVGPGVQVMAVLKADGYGHGAIKVAHTLLNNGASWLGVACAGEAIALRQAGIDSPILILGYTPPWQAREVVLHNVVATVFSGEVAAALSRAALDLGRQASVHVKVDTGMGRLGLLPSEALPFMRELQALPALQVDGIFTHMAAADESDLSYTHWQLEQFDAVLDELRAEGLLPAHIHAANSACLLRLPASHYNMVRPGIALYGLNPSAQVACPPGFAPALEFKCQVAQVKELPAGSFVSYGRTFCTDRPSRIAVIPVGYADGFRRAPTHWGTVLVRGQRAPIVGRVCMDQTMIDVTDIPGVRQGDEVVLIGAQGDDRITVDEVAESLGTINYEVVSQILARVPRIV